MNSEQDQVQTLTEKKEENGNLQETTEISDECHHSLEDKLEELLKLGWTMLPQSCNSPCK